VPSSSLNKAVELHFVVLQRISSNCFTNTLQYSSINVYNMRNMSIRDLRRVCGKIPIVLCGNKADAPRKALVTPYSSICRKKFQIPYYSISVKNRWRLEDPLLWLLRMLTGEKTLCFVESPAYMPPPLPYLHLQYSEATNRRRGGCDVIDEFWKMLK
jgi:hypothetical protein